MSGKIITLSLLLVGLLQVGHLAAQNNHVFNLVEGDSLSLMVEARGAIQWESSPDSLSWEALPGEQEALLSIRPPESSYYRARITEGDCDPLWSDPTFARLIPLDERKNIVFILVDDMGWRDLVCYGSDYYETPNIDRLASQGVSFTRAYAAHPVCSPTRSSIATGQYPQRLHVSSYIPGTERPYAKLAHPHNWQKYLEMSEITYAEALQEKGYRTFHSGKWHLGRLLPGYHGFEDIERDLNHSGGTDDPKNDMLYTEAAMDFIEANSEGPFLVTISHNTVHVPLETSQALEDKYNAKEPGSFGQDNAVMAGMIETLDESVGLLLDKLEELDLVEETYVIFFSDNGGLASATSNHPLRGGKSQLYEGGIRVPMIISGPRLEEGKQVAYPVISNDIFPTMLEMAGAELMPDSHEDGLSLMPLLRGEKASLERENLFFHYPHYHTMAPHSAVRSGNWKLIEHHEDGRVELFDLVNDPAESNDLAGSMEWKRDELLELLHTHLSEVGAQLPAPNPDYDPARENEKTYGTFDDSEYLQEEYLNWEDRP